LYKSKSSKKEQPEAESPPDEKPDESDGDDAEASNLLNPERVDSLYDASLRSQQRQSRSNARTSRASKLHGKKRAPKPSACSDMAPEPDAPDQQVILSVAANLLYKYDKDTKVYRCVHTGPLMCAITGAWSSYYLIVYDFGQMHLINFFIGSQLQCQHTPELSDSFYLGPQGEQGNPDLQAHIVAGRHQTQYRVEFRDTKDLAKFIRTVALVRAHLHVSRIPSQISSAGPVPVVLADMPPKSGSEAYSITAPVCRAGDLAGCQYSVWRKTKDKTDSPLQCVADKPIWSTSTADVAKLGARSSAQDDKKSPVLEKVWAGGEPAALAGLELIVEGMRKGGRRLALIPDPVLPADVAGASAAPAGKKGDKQWAIVCVDLRKMKKANKTGGSAASASKGGKSGSGSARASASKEDSLFGFDTKGTHSVLQSRQSSAGGVRIN
jgi:hypothetical protein